jgi:hypothetical protein
MNEIEIKSMMKNYATIRIAVASAEEELKKMVDHLKQSDDYKTIEDWLIINKQSLEELDKDIREEAINQFEMTGSKHPWQSVGIREVTKYDYDLPKAVEWAKQNMPAILTVDKKKFEKVLSVTSPETLPETIKVYKEAIATIASDLSMYKEDEDES